MIRRLTLAALLGCSSVGLFAQNADAQKQQLAQKLLTLWKPETIVVAMVQRPAVDAMQQSRIALQGRVSADKQAATMKAIQGDVQTFIDQATPVALADAQKQSAPTLVPMLVQNFSVEELQQLIALLESPVRVKFEQMAPKLEKALGDKVVADISPVINPKLKALTENVGGKLRAAAGQ